MKKDSEYRKTEAWLYNYKNLAGAIRQCDIQIQQIKEDIRGCGAIRYDGDKLSKSYNISKSVENEVIERERRIEEIQSRKKTIELHKESIEVAINNFNSDQKILFENLYINKNGWTRDRIIMEMGISKDTYYRIKDSLVRSAINSMNPERAMKDIEDKYVF